MEGGILHRAQRAELAAVGVDAELDFHQVPVGFRDLVAKVLLGAVGGFDAACELVDLAVDLAQEFKGLVIRGFGGGGGWGGDGGRGGGSLGGSLAGEDAGLPDAFGQGQPVVDDGGGHQGEGEGAGAGQQEGFHFLSGLGRDKRSWSSWSMATVRRRSAAVDWSTDWARMPATVAVC